MAAYYENFKTMVIKQISRSPDINKFRIERELMSVENCEKTAEEAQSMIDFYESWEQRRLELEETDEWKINNMEYDLRTTDWILEKVRSNEAYAQNLYAAMCNNNFRKIDVVEILKETSWSCSWRSAGGIVANMRGSGDYMDYYCSGIRGLEDSPSDEQYQAWTKEQREYYHTSKNFVSESTVTREIREDLKRLGWMVLAEGNDNF